MNCSLFRWPAAVLSGAVFTSTAVGTAYASAKAETLAVRVDLLGSAQCGSADAFFQRLHALAEVRLASPEEPAENIQVWIEKGTQGFQGRLEIHTTLGTESRGVSAQTCEEVLDTLALTTSMSLQGAQPSDPEKPPPEPKSPAKRAAPKPVEPGRVPSASTPVAGGRNVVELGGAVLGSELPWLMGPAINVRFGLTAQSLDLAFQVAYLTDALKPSENVRMSGPFAGVGACASGLANAQGSLYLSPCVTTEVGVLFAKGTAELVAARSAEVLYGMSGLVFRGGVRSGGGWGVEVGAGASVAWLQPGLRTDAPGEILGESGAFALRGELGLARTF
ncbi:MAG: hypothetical protein SFV15_26830 [Polyangiaceae bacterium]|nr:hypothetical protein [Polyangiaceae bacterium]